MILNIMHSQFIILCWMAQPGRRGGASLLWSTTCKGAMNWRGVNQFWFHHKFVINRICFVFFFFLMVIPIPGNVTNEMSSTISRHSSRSLAALTHSANVLPVNFLTWSVYRGRWSAYSSHSFYFSLYGERLDVILPNYVAKEFQHSFSDCCC